MKTEPELSAFPWSGQLRELATQAAQRLGEEMNAQAVWLFGSAARLETNSNSDIDLLAIVPASSEAGYRRAQRAQKLLADIRVPKDIIVLTRAEWDAQLKVPASLPSAVNREGVLLYGA